MSSMSIAHIFEYLFVCAYHFKELKWDSFLINQSSAYVIAAVVSWIEFYFENGHKPKILVNWSLKIGVCMIFIGHFCRITALFTARKSFHHIV